MKKPSLAMLAMSVLMASNAAKIEETSIPLIARANSVRGDDMQTMQIGQVINMGSGLGNVQQLHGEGPKLVVGKTVLSSTPLITTTSSSSHLVGQPLIELDSNLSSGENKYTITSVKTASGSSLPQGTTLTLIPKGNGVGNGNIKISQTQVINLQSNSQQKVVPGGYRLITNIESNQDAQNALTFAKSSGRAFFSSAKLLQASSQVVNGTNYQFLFQIDFGVIKAQYVIVVYKPIHGNAQISRGEFLNLTRPAVESYKHFEGAAIKTVAYIDQIDVLLKSSLKQYLTATSQINSVDYYGPFYIIKYSVDANTNLKVELSYDGFLNTVNVYASARQITEKVVSQQKTTVTENKSTTTTTVQKVSVPISVSKATLAKYGLTTEGVSFSDIMPYDDKVASGFYNLDASYIQLNDIVQAILSTVNPQIQKIDANYKINLQKFRVEQKKLTFFIVYTIRGQKSMQSIYIILPNVTIYERFYKFVPSTSTVPTQSPQVPLASTVSTKPTQTVNTVNTVTVTSSTLPTTSTTNSSSSSSSSSVISQPTTVVTVPPIQSQTSTTTVIQRDDKPVRPQQVVTISRPQETVTIVENKPVRKQQVITVVEKPVTKPQVITIIQKPQTKPTITIQPTPSQQQQQQTSSTTYTTTTQSQPTTTTTATYTTQQQPQTSTQIINTSQQVISQPTAIPIINQQQQTQPQLPTQTDQTITFTQKPQPIITTINQQPQQILTINQQPQPLNSSMPLQPTPVSTTQTEQIITTTVTPSKPQIITTSQPTQIIITSQPQTTSQSNSQQIITITQQQPQQPTITTTTSLPQTSYTTQEQKSVITTVQQPVTTTTTTVQQQPVTATSTTTTTTLINHDSTSQTNSNTPFYTISNSHDALLQTVSGISDPALVPFLTGTYSLDLDNKQIDTIMQFVIKKVGITNKFTIVLVNQIKYGIRFILQMEDHKLFQAVITSDNQSPQLLSWQRIGIISDVDPDVFSHYYKIDADEDLKSLIREVFKNNTAISNFKQILNSEKKISFDGVYYRIILESVSGNRYVLVFYYIPDKKYNQILQYQLIDNGYDASKQTRFTTLPENDTLFNAAKYHINNNYANVLKDSTISSVSTCSNSPYQYYRFNFEGLNGKYEAIQTVNSQSLVSSVSRWEKLQAGYVPLDLNLLSTSPQFASIRASLQTYIKSKFSFDATPSYLQLKKVPAVGSFYKFTFDKPFPFSLSLQERETDHSLYIRGMERIQIAPSSQYYNDRVFSGYSVLSVTELQFDYVYQAFYTELLSQTGVTSTNNQVLAAFRKKSPLGIYYKVIYSVNSKTFLATYAYEFIKSKYQLISFEPYSPGVEPGDYRWKCTSINDKNKVCDQCDSDNLLTSGRCYSKLNGCSFQVASTCKVCSSGFLRVNHACEKSPQKAIPQVAVTANPVVTQTVTTTSGPQTVIFSGMDFNCLVSKDSVCQQCSYRYFVSNGVCKKAQDECDVYDKQTGTCFKCYNGYYLSNGVCNQLDPLCAQANPDGFCTKCFKSYIGIDGKCYAESNVKLSTQTISTVTKDQLCIEWTGSQCTKCQYGTYMSKKTGACTIQDPFCQQFDQSSEECVICERGYKKTGANKCTRAY